MDTSNPHSIRSELAHSAARFYDRGWVLGTSGNFSAVTSRDPFRIAITGSGLDKGSLNESSFLEIDSSGRGTSDSVRPSAETRLHLTIYTARPRAGSVLHTHSVWGTVLSDAWFGQGAIEISGYEMLKGLAGVITHEHTERVPVIENSQDYDSLAREIDGLLANEPDIHGFYLRRHGLYTWGETVAEARRHIEILEFLFEVVGRTHTHKVIWQS